MRRLATALLAILLAAPAGAEPPLPELPGIGRLGNRQEDSRPSCSGTLIGPRQVLTAAHCIVGNRPDSASFFIGWTAEGAAERIDVLSATRGRKPAVLSERAADVAILNLARRPAAATPLPLVRGLVRGGLGRVIAYPWAENYERRDLTCPVIETRGAEVLLDCPSQGGMSGGPLLVNRGGGWGVAGVVIARTGDGRTIAVRLDRVDLVGLPDIP